MKLNNLLFLMGFIFINNSYSQETNNYFVSESDNNFLRNYKAPDLKIRGLNFVFDGFGQGATSEFDNDQRITGRAGLGFFEFLNKTKYQGNTSAYFESGFNLRNHNAIVDYRVFFQGYHNTQNRFYFKDQWFVGIHNQSNLNLSIIENNNDLDIVIKPAFSIGHGRIEPVGYARVAMDVERLLIKGGRFNSNFSENNRTDLANKIAKIQTKRFFDPRLARIYQLQSLDSILQNMGVIVQDDITYFSLLQDAFLYGTSTFRYSGLRHELGITEGINLLSNGNDEFMNYGFYKFSYFLPKSYIIQHNITASLLGGVLVDNSQLTPNEFPIWLDANYEIGFYPTTRTFLSASVLGGLNYNTTLGFITGANLNAYYYISPRFRFSIDGQMRIGKNYSAHDFNIAVSNLNRVTAQTNYSFRMGLIYSIF